MKAAVVFGKNDIRFMDWEEPQIQRPDEVKIRVRACGICRSDVPRVFAGTARYYPIILGHEFSGIVEAAGEEAEKAGIRPGDHVAGVPLIPCFQCPDCAAGNYSLCKQYSFIGSRQQGAYAEFVVVPVRNVVKLDPDVPFEKAALIETATVALHGLFLAGLDEKTAPQAASVAVTGVGTIGLLAVQWARILGAKRITAIGRDGERLELARRLGATDTINTREEDAEARAAELTGGVGFSYLFDSAGAPETIRQCFHLAANKAHVCLIGTPTADVTFSWREWELINRKEFNLTGSWMSYSAPFPGREWEYAVAAMRDGSLLFEEAMLHRRFDLSQVREAFDCFEKEKVRGRILLTNNR